MTLDLVCFQQSTFQERVLFTRVCIISGSRFYVKRLSARYKNMCEQRTGRFRLRELHVYASTHYSMTRVNLGKLWRRHSHYYARTSDTRIRAALDKSSSWFKQSTSCFTCLTWHTRSSHYLCFTIFVFRILYEYV